MRFESANANSALDAPPRQKFLHGAAMAFVLVASSTALAWVLLHIDSLDWRRYPIAYDGDAILHLVFIKRLIDGAGYFENIATGYPFHSLLYDFPGSDGLSLLALKWLGGLSKSPALAFNIYYLVGFPLAASCAYFVLRRFRATPIMALVCSLLFAFLPFHFLRLQHLYYTWYFTIPLFVGVSAWIAVPSAVDFPQLNTWLRRILYGLVLLAMASLGVYFAFFGAMLIGLAGVYGAIDRKKWQPLITAGFAIVIITAGVLVNLAPNLIFFASHGRNQEVAQRNSGETELYGLKTAQLLLPRPQHRVQAFAAANARYSTRFPNVNENATSSLGLVGSVGLLFLLFATLSPRRLPHSQLIAGLGFLTLATLLIATVGGFSSLFALFITPLIRAWNRISVFLAFMALAGFALGFDRWLNRTRRSFAIMLGVFVLAFGLWDQTDSDNLPAAATSKLNYQADQKFIAAIEASIPKGTPIYQLPYMTFPEAVPRGTLGSYDLGVGYLHSNDLHWNFGVATGRKGDEFYETLAEQPIALQLELLRYLGFGGIYIARKGYPDHGAALENALQSILTGPSFVQDDGNVAFYALPPLAGNGTPQLSPAAEKLRMSLGLTKVADDFVFMVPPTNTLDFTKPLGRQVDSAKGMFDPEPWGAWSDGRQVVLVLKSELPEHFSLDLTAKGIGPNVGSSSMLTIGGSRNSFKLTADLQTFHFNVDVPPGSNTIEITVPHPVSPKQLGINDDTRMIGLGIQSLTVVARHP